MAEKIWNWGIIGCGLISHDFTNCLVKDKRANVVGCAARSAESAAEFAARFGIAKSFGDYQALCNDPDVEIVYIGTLNPQHKKQTIMALNAGKHVICEKPLGMNKREVEEMIAAAQANKRFLMEAIWTRFTPAFNRVRQLISERTIGDIVSYKGNFSWLITAPRLWSIEMGGGGLLDLGVYNLHYLPALFGAQNRPETVKAIASLVNGVDSVCAANIKYGVSQYAQVSTDIYSNGFNSHVIVGTKGIITLPYHCPIDYKLQLFNPNTPDIRTPHKIITEEFALPTGFSQPFNFFRSELLSYEATGVMDALDKGQYESEQYTWDEMRHLVEVSDAIRAEIGLVYPAD